MHAHEETGSADGGIRRNPARALPWIIGGALLACFFAMVRKGYFIRSYSDCHNWLSFARNFGWEYTHSRWPYGYPLFLRGALALAGPYWVFLANLPVMLGMFAVMAWFGTLFRGEDRGGRGAAALPAGWAFLTVWIPVLAADAWSFWRYLNPYRDPLSYALLMASMLLFVRSLGRRRPAGVAASGAVLGLAASVREPSILMVLPFLAYGVWVWAGAKKEVAFWKTAGAFSLGLGLALVPLLVQTYLTTHQMLLPPQASIESNVVPGAHFDGPTFRQTGGAAWTHYSKCEPCLLLLAAAGLVAAVRRRNRLVLALTVPAAVAYAVFYAFYWTFVIRYYYVAVLFLVLTAGYGAQTFLGWLCGRWPRWGRTAGWGLLAVAAGMAGWRLLACRPAYPPHQIPHAKAFAAALDGACPGATVVYTDRLLCEWLDWFMPYVSHPLPAGDGNSAALREELGARLERGETLYSAVWGGEDIAGEDDEPFLRRAFDRIPAAVVDPGPHRASEYARKPIHFYRIQPWSGHRTELAWPAPCREPYWFMLDTGTPLEAASCRDAEPIGVTVDGVRLPEPLPHGGAQVGAGLPRACDGGEGRAVLESAGLLPREMRFASGSLNEPLTLDFRFHSGFDHRWRLRGEFHWSRERFHTGPCVPSAVDAEIPVPWPEVGGVVLEWDVMTPAWSADGFVDVGAYEDGRRLAGAHVPAGRRATKLIVPLPDDPGRDVRIVRLEVENRSEPAEPDEPPPSLEICQVRIHRRPPAYPVEFLMDGEMDTTHVLSGFHPAEGWGLKSYRWTDGAAEAAMYAPLGSGRDVVVRLAYTTRAVPPEVNGDGRIQVSWDGEPVEGFIEGDEGGTEFVWFAALPADRVGTETPHRLRVESPSWRPADRGEGDTRTLGVCMQRIGMEELATPEYPVVLRPGEETALFHVLSGFNSVEGRGDGAFRWTTGAGEVAMILPSGNGKDVALRIAYATDSLPRGINSDGTLRVLWDGDPVEGSIGRVAEDGLEYVWSGVLPADRAGSGSAHRLRMESPFWRPAEYGFKDSRKLGVKVRRIEMAETGAGGGADAP